MQQRRKLRVKGKIVHPGYAKGKMINSMYYASKFIEALPKNETPEKTEGYEGFYHFHSMEGNVEDTLLHYIVRDHDRDKFESENNILLI